jgi:hypothetical protein
MLTAKECVEYFRSGPQRFENWKEQMKGAGLSGIMLTLQIKEAADKQTASRLVP